MLHLLYTEMFLSTDSQALMDVCRNGHGEAAPAEDPVAKSAERVKRLKILVQLRKLYRNLLRAERLLATTSPVYQKLTDVKPVKGTRVHFIGCALNLPSFMMPSLWTPRQMSLSACMGCNQCSCDPMRCNAMQCYTMLQCNAVQ